MRDLPRLEAVARATVEALAPFPVTAKIRLGWDEESIVAPEACERLESAGVAAITIHGRTRVQGYRGSGDLAAIVRIAASRNVPIIANGSIETSEQIAWLRDETAVDGAMIGRAALGYPWLFARLQAAAQGLPTPPEPSQAERWQTLLAYAADLVERQERQYGNRSLRGIRARLKAFTKGMAGSARLRREIESIDRIEELRALCTPEGEVPTTVAAA
jgi:tRNA-dihydrouridine synthase